MAAGFVKLNRSEQSMSLLSSDPKSFHLLTWIAFRASRETGEALIGDWKSMGATSEAAYRRTKKRLEATGLATFKPTSKGTIAKLVDTHVYDINMIEADDQSDEQPDDQSIKKPTIQPTTNKKFKKLNTRKKKGMCLEDQQFRQFFELEVLQLGVPQKQITEWLGIRKTNTKHALRLQLKYLNQVIAMGFSAKQVFEVLLGNEWIGIKPKETYFVNELKGLQNERDELNDTSWQNDKHAVYDIPGNISELAKRPEPLADQSCKKIVG